MAKPIRFVHRNHLDAKMWFLNELLKEKYLDPAKFEKYGKAGVRALAAATPIRSGKTAASWEYKIEKTETGLTIAWYNTNVNKGENIAMLIQFGHGKRNGGYVPAIDYINPALRPVFDRIVEETWKEVIQT